MSPRNIRTANKTHMNDALEEAAEPKNVVQPTKNSELQSMTIDDALAEASE